VRGRRAGPPFSRAGDFNRGCPVLSRFLRKGGRSCGHIMTDTVWLRMTHRRPLPPIENRDGRGSQGVFRATRKRGPAPASFCFPPWQPETTEALPVPTSRTAPDVPHLAESRDPALACVARALLPRNGTRRDRVLQIEPCRAIMSAFPL